MSQQSNHHQTSVPDLSPTIGSQPSSITEDMWDTFEWPAEQEKEQEWSEEEQCAQGTPTESQMPTDSQIDSIMNWRPPFATSRDHVPAAALEENRRYEPSSPMATSTQRGWDQEEQGSQDTPTESQLASIFDWRTMVIAPSRVPFPVTSAPDLRDRGNLEYHPALNCRQCWHSVVMHCEGDVQVYKTTTYPCNLHKVVKID